MSKRVTVVAIIAAYNEEDIIGQVVRTSIAEDVEVYLIDHRSTDRTVAEVEPYLGRGVIGIERFPVDSAERDETADVFAWKSILRRKEALGRDLKVDWFIHHDADEFRESPWTGLGLREAIQRMDAAGYSAVDFQVLSFWPAAGEVHGPGDVREALRCYEVGSTWDRVQIKY